MARPAPLSLLQNAGAQQLLADSTALAGIFQPYTQKPAAHFRETLAACRLLMLSDDEASEVVRRVSALEASEGPAAYKKDSLLLHLGAVCLTPHQMIAVIERRV